MSRDALLSLADHALIAERTGGVVQLGLHLPIGVDNERIEVNAARLQRLTHLAGAQVLHLATETTENQIVAFDAQMHADGSATVAGLRRRPEQSIASGEYDDTNHPLKRLAAAHPNSNHVFKVSFDQTYKADSLNLFINKTVVQNKLNQNDNYKRGMVDELGWAAELTKATQQGFTAAARNRYLPTQGEGPEFVRDIVAKGFMAFCIAKRLDILSGVCLTANFGHRLLQYLPVGLNWTDSENFNYSAFTAFRYDRALATAVLANTSRLFKVKK